MALKARLWFGVLGLIALGLLIAIYLYYHEPRSRLYNGKTIKAWSMQLQSPTPVAREEARNVFISLGSNAVSPLCELLAAKDSRIRKFIWAKAGVLPRPVRVKVMKRLRVPDADATHQAAAQAAALIGPDAAETVPLLLVVLEKNSGDSAWAAGAALGHMGAAALPGLAKLTLHTNEAVRQAATMGLGMLGTNAVPAISELLDRMSDTNRTIRSVAEQSVAEVGLPATDALLSTVKGETGIRQQNAARLLGIIHASRKRSEGPLLQMLKDPDPKSQQAALDALGALHASSPETIAAMIEMLKAPDRNVRLAAAHALGEVSWKAQPALPPLINALSDEDAAVRAVTAATLGKMGALALPALPSLEQRQNEDADQLVRTAAKDAIGRINAKP